VQFLVWNHMPHTTDLVAWEEIPKRKMNLAQLLR